MNFIQHPECNGSLGAPYKWDEQNPNLQCDALPILREYHQDGVKSHPVVSSFWKPTPNELIMLNNGACVKLIVFGQSMQPVILEVTA